MKYRLISDPLKEQFGIANDSNQWMLPLRFPTVPGSDNPYATEYTKRHFSIISRREEAVFVRFNIEYKTIGGTYSGHACFIFGFHKQKEQWFRLEPDPEAKVVDRIWLDSTQIEIEPVENAFARGDIPKLNFSQADQLGVTFVGQVFYEAESYTEWLSYRDRSIV